MRVFIGPAEIANYYGPITRGLRELGVAADFVPFAKNRFDYGYQPSGPLIKAINWAHAKRASLDRRRNFLFKLGFVLLCEFLQTVYFFVAIVRYDVFVFSYGKSLLIWNLDVPILKLLGKRMIFCFNGSDARPEYVDGAVMAPSRGVSISDCIRLVARKKKQLNLIEKYAHEIVSLVGQSIIMTRPHIDRVSIGQLNLDDEEAALATAIKPRGENESVRILHSPSHPEAKGTQEIRAIISRLQQRHDIEWVEVIDRPNHEVLEELRNCHFVIDQLYSDQPMAGFAMEAAWYGRPPVVGGYWAAFMHDTMPANHIPPGPFVTPDRVEETIERLIVDDNYRVQVAREVREFVARRWCRKAVAARWKIIIEGQDIKREWYQDPMKSDYFLGACISAKMAREIVTNIVKQGGESALQLDDKPRLKERLLAFAQGRLSHRPDNMNNSHMEQEA